MIRSTTLSALAIIISTCGAMAADIPGRMPANAPAPVYAPISTWSGFYTGINAGAAFSNRGSVTELNPVIATDALYNGAGALAAMPRRTAFTGGLQAGYNVQSGQGVFGLEGDFNYLGYKAVGLQGGVDSFGIKKANWLATLRGRAGITYGQTLFYVTAGAAASDLKYRFSDTCNVAPCGGGLASGSASPRWGWTAGAGFEYALNQNWSVKGEYFFVRFRDANFHSVVAGGAPTTINHQANRTDFHIARIGLNYRFGGTAAPVMAKY